MSLVNCRECGHEVSTTAKSCPSCGARVPKFKWWLWVPVGLFGAFMLFGFLVGNSPDGKEKLRRRAAISLCWEEQKRKSLSPSERQFIAGACERMESEFTSQYGVRP